MPMTQPLFGLMQDVPLTVDRFLDHAATWHGAREIVSREGDGSLTRLDYAWLHQTAKRVSNALARAGIGQGDRVATMGWNSARHLAAWYGATNMGAVLHTLNPRLFAELARRGWSDAELANLAQGNVLRVMERVEAVAASQRNLRPVDAIEPE